MIRIGFSRRDRNHLSRLIRHMTGSPVSHCWFLIDEPFFGVEMVIEASEFGYRIIPYAGYEKANTIVTLVEPRWPIEDAVRASAAWLGSRYDFAGLFGMGAVLVGRWLRRKLKNPFTSAHALFCSEAVVRTLQLAQYPGAGALDPENTSPADLLAFLKAEGPAA